MTITLASKPGLNSATALSIPTTWDPTWFRNFINNMLKGADVRNAIAGSGITITGSIASPYATISIGGSGPVTLPGPVTINPPASGTTLIVKEGSANQGIDIWAGVANGSALIQGYNSTGATRTGYLDFISGTVGIGGATETILGNDGATSADYLSLVSGGARRLQISGTGISTFNTPTGGSAFTAGVVNDSSFYAYGTYQRNGPTAGYLDGGYAGHETTTTPGCIYSIGGASYVPGTTTLGTMYGIGYCYSNSTLITGVSVPASKWGMYVAQGGTAGVFLSADGGGYFNTVVETPEIAFYNGTAATITATPYTFGSITVSGTTGGYPGIQFTSAYGAQGRTLMVSNASAVQGFYDTNASTWDWYINSAGIYAPATASTGTAVIRTSGGIYTTSSSSARYKINVQDMASSDDVLKLRPVTYTLNPQTTHPESDFSQVHVGLIAEEVATVLPNLVSYTPKEMPARGPDGKQLAKKPDGTPYDTTPRPESVQYDRLTVLLLDVVRRLAARVAVLESK